MLSKKEWSRRFKTALKEELDMNRNDIRTHCWFALNQWRRQLSPLEAVEEVVFLLTTGLPAAILIAASEAARGNHANQVK